MIVWLEELVQGLYQSIKKSWRQKISMLITYPPIRFPCYAGIDFPSMNELATFVDGSKLSEEEIIEKVRSDIGADFLGYNDAENLAAAIGMPKDILCFTCSTGNYDSLGIKPEFRTREEMKGE